MIIILYFILNNVSDQFHIDATLERDTCNKQGFAFKLILDLVEFCRPSLKYKFGDLIPPNE